MRVSSAGRFPSLSKISQMASFHGEKLVPGVDGGGWVENLRISESQNLVGCSQTLHIAPTHRHPPPATCWLRSVSINGARRQRQRQVSRGMSQCHRGEFEGCRSFRLEPCPRLQYAPGAPGSVITPQLKLTIGAFSCP